ncbi:uncharacterized protein LOC111407235 isoform X2 [Olea europaea var. sylvestris]|uniref:uncharacterized protein LOC111407235 isoform X2 n=1 Tax=Olea europaea var. sylvestris TaxID=158386 RepID=UPI000C1D40C6|nr:uncharacterized protein LOC111407235 isoform X2 [Olea europaea var. sylvestris]
MSTSKGNSGNGVQAIPAGSRKMVLSLKEIVNCPEAEIYATLKDCNMDPNEAVHRLLSQDPFHEVKSKREKKKENKDTSESRSRGASNNSNRGSKNSSDRSLWRGGSTPYNSSESGPLHGKGTYKKESGSSSYPNTSTSVSIMTGSITNTQPPALSDVATTEYKASSDDAAYGVSSGLHPPSYQPAWVGVPGQVTMADIVKMGRPQKKATSAHNVANNGNRHHVEGHSSTTSHHNSSQDVSAIDEWPSIERPVAAKMQAVSEPSVEPELHPDASDLPFDGIHQHSETEEEVWNAEDDNIENLGTNDMVSTSISNRNIPEDNSGGASLFEDHLYENMGSYQHHGHPYENEEVEEVGVSVSSVAANLQQLSVQQDDQGLPADADGPSVVIPDHLQVQTADCSHLSFGSFGSGMSAVFSSGPSATTPVKANLEEVHRDADVSSIDHSDNRTGASSGSYDASQPEELKPVNIEMAHGNQYAFPTPNTDYTFDNAQHLNVAYAQSQTSSQIQNLTPYSNVMPSHTNSLPSTLLAANVHSARESDLQYSPFPVTQSLPTKFGNSASSIGGSAISMPEALKTSSFPSTQPTQLSLSGTSVASGPPLPQHLPVHPYSQPSLPLGPFANMIGYPFLPQSYPYMPSAFQQQFAGNNTYHQSLAAVLPQYKNSVSVSSLPQSAAVASGYGGFGSTTTIPGNFLMNPPAAPSGTNLSYDDVLSSQYKDSSHLINLQQNENSPMWLHGANSRTVSAVPASTYYNYQGQSQQSGGFRQGQHPSQSYGALGYPNFYHSQTGISQDHQQPNPRDGSLEGSQGQPKQSQQLWQNY